MLGADTSLLFSGCCRSSQLRCHSIEFSQFLGLATLNAASTVIVISISTLSTVFIFAGLQSVILSCHRGNKYIYYQSGTTDTLGNGIDDSTETSEYKK